MASFPFGGIEGAGLGGGGVWGVGWMIGAGCDKVVGWLFAGRVEGAPRFMFYVSCLTIPGRQGCIVCRLV